MCLNKNFLRSHSPEPAWTEFFSDELLYFFCILLKCGCFAAFNMMLHELSCMHWYDVDVKVSYHLPCGFAIVLYDSDAVCVYCFIDGYRNFLANLEDLCNFFVWDFVDVLVVFFRYDKGVAWVYGVIAQESYGSLVFVDSAVWGLVADYLAEYARFSHESYLSAL
jgi:hypothetical protein